MESLETRIRALCHTKHAVILAHNYTLPEVQDVADFVGDSLELALRAATVAAEIIVFCGVRFMAETAKLLNPRCLVLMPDPRAGCPLADMIDARALQQARLQHPGCTVVCYVNTTAEVKAEADICCTSANAKAIVEAIPAERPVLFVPDRNLGSWVAEQLDRELVLWDGYCPTHERIVPEQLERTKALHPQALVVMHPECSVRVRALSDHIASTSGMLSYCRDSRHSEFIIATEHGLLHRLRRESPDKTFFEARPHMGCPNMKLTTPDNLLWCLEDLTGGITVDEETVRRARRAIERMFSSVPATSTTRENHP